MSNMNLDTSFGGVYQGKSVLVTGHTGFKGSWLSGWLTLLGARVTGYSAYLPSDPCNFLASGIQEQVIDHRADVRDLGDLEAAFREAKPEVVFHLAAQPLVRASYDDPKTTFDTNVGGTVNVLEAVRRTPSVRCAVIITSDKCYRNVEWPWGYRETDELGGDDPYGASKAGAEMACRAYAASFFGRDASSPRMVTVRAGNVVGGGDWAQDRIVPDCVRAWSEGGDVEIRSPEATRPWQHVLEPLSGYLWLATRLLEDASLHGQAFNFGPRETMTRSVEDLVRSLAEHWPGANWHVGRSPADKKENTLLKLSCDKARLRLGWSAVLDFDETVAFTGDWYRAYYDGNADMGSLGQDQVAAYTDLARGQGLAWAT